jgi:hypothetical protein
VIGKIRRLYLSIYPDTWDGGAAAAKRCRRAKFGGAGTEEMVWCGTTLVFSMGVNETTAAPYLS